MRKILMTTSAMAILASNPADAAEWEVRVGGYMEQYLAYATSDIQGLRNFDYDGVDPKQESEIHFLPSVTLDNGIRIGVDIQLEGETQADQIDESYLFITGSFGKVVLGSENSAGYIMQVTAPDVTFINANSGSLTFFVPYSGTVSADNNGDGIIGGIGTGETVQVGSDLTRGTLSSTTVENVRNNDPERFTYYTPNYGGFQFGLSYARDTLQDNQAQQDCNVQVCNIFDVGARFTRGFGDFSVDASARWGIASNNVPGAGDPQVWAAGLNLGYGGVTIGGSFAEQNNAGALDGTAFDAGIKYETGPWGFSFTYLRGENVNNENALDVLGNDEKLQIFLLGLNYDLAKGVRLGAFGAFIDFDEERGDAGGNAVATGDDVEGFVLGTGIKVTF